jgi:hypothetical protein
LLIGFHPSGDIILNSVVNLSSDFPNPLHPLVISNTLDTQSLYREVKNFLFGYDPIQNTIPSVVGFWQLEEAVSDNSLEFG